MDNELLKQKYSEMIKMSGGGLATLARLMKFKVYGSLFLRCKKNVETVIFDKRFEFEGRSLLVDLCTPTGITKLRLPAYSSFELKYNPDADSIYRTKELAIVMKQIYPNAKLYFIYDQKGQLTDKVIRDAKREKLFEIWQVDAFVEHINKVKQINDQIESLERDWKDKRKAIIESARFSFRENKCSLFLGAGVSMSAGGPSWEDLLYKTIKKSRKSFTKRDFKKIYESCGQSPIVMGRYLAPDKHTLGIITDYLQAYVLYKGVNLSNSELIKAICEFVETDKVESVVTYNYDDLVETAINQRGRKRAFSVVAKSRNTKEEIPVYHVHGLIPHHQSEMAATPVLSEKDYHDIYRESFHWSNIEQLHALDRNSCFFIGLSMTDPNLRRLLDFSYAGNDNEIHHYAFMKRESLYGTDDVEKNKSHFKTIEEQLESVGVWVIWYERHNEIPRIIRDIIAPMRLMNY